MQCCTFHRPRDLIVDCNLEGVSLDTYKREVEAAMYPKTAYPIRFEGRLDTSQYSREASEGFSYAWKLAIDKDHAPIHPIWRNVAACKSQVVGASNTCMRVSGS